MNADTIEAFGDELTKIAVLKSMARGFGSALKEGWHQSGGRIGKALTVAGTAVQAPLALAKDDWTGQGRSRTERTMGLAGDAAGGLIGTGLGVRAANRVGNALKLQRGRGALGFAGMTAGAIGGGLLGKHMLSAPSRLLRERQQRNAPPQPAMQPEQGVPV